MTKRRIEPLVWLTFSGGGVAAATVLPVLVLLFAFALPLGWVAAPDHEHLRAVVQHPLTILVLLGTFAVILVHAAHRFRYTLYDGLQVKHQLFVALLCYGSAAAGTLLALIVLAEPL